MRLLHRRHSDDRAYAPFGRTRCRRRSYSRSPVGQYLPLHRLCADRRGGARRARCLSGEGGRCAMNAPRNVYIGQDIERTEDFRFLTGRGTFVDDYEPAGLLHAAILRSSIPHGRIAGIDASAALKMPGVHAVITARDIGTNGAAIPRIPIRLAPIAGIEKYLQPVIAVGKVRYVGEPLAVIVADSRAIAEDAAGEIDVRIDPLAPVADWRAS